MCRYADVQILNVQIADMQVYVLITFTRLFILIGLCFVRTLIFRIKGFPDFANSLIL